MESMPGWVRIVAVLAVIFGIVGLVAGAWMFAPLIIAGIIGLVAARRRTP